MFSKALLCCLTLLPLGILAAVDDKGKLANRTIDRVSLRPVSGYVRACGATRTQRLSV